MAIKSAIASLASTQAGETEGQEYDGMHCPNCGSIHTDRDSGEHSDSRFCNDCDAHWTEVYELKGYEGLKLAAPHAESQEDQG